MTGRRATALASATLAGATACSGGINAGVQGGRAFIAMTVMLLLMVAALWAAIGRGE